ncbi:GNAT family N-acetyltransferase [Limosilactobacillus fastidiosus]|uniref:GNAT family N-acetyltransferase n=1 Tax=Limosilactobacillus fastidiosus TaxID=2759855 RepID=UPI00355901C4
MVVGNQIVGTAALQLTPDPTYKNIQNGQWKQPNEPYATIHRVAISSRCRGQGLSSILFSNLITVGQLQKRSNFRFDTHEKNQRMQKIVKKFGFIRRGEINVVDNNDPKRVAFELNLHRNYKIHKVTNTFMKGLLK